MKDLTELQKKTLTIICAHKSDNPITNKELTKITKMIERQSGKEGADMRAVINALRVKGFPICSSDRGYFIASTSDELSRYISQLEGRIASIQQAADGLKLAYSRVGMHIQSEYVANYDPDRTIKVYSVRSETEPSRVYSVTALDTGMICDCIHFKYNQNCKHIESIQKRIKERDQPQQSLFGKPAII